MESGPEILGLFISLKIDFTFLFQEMVCFGTGVEKYSALRGHQCFSNFFVAVIVHMPTHAMSSCYY